jgi:hypothetical protein
VETRFKLMTPCSDTMINYQLFQKVKLLENGEFNHLPIMQSDVMKREVLRVYVIGVKLKYY